MEFAAGSRGWCGIDLVGYKDDKKIGANFVQNYIRE